MYGCSHREMIWRGFSILARCRHTNAQGALTQLTLLRCYTTIVLPSRRCRSTAHSLPSIAYSASKSEKPFYDAPSGPAPKATVRIPRLLFFGGDTVSVIALEALYQRLYCIAHHALACRDCIDVRGSSVAPALPWIRCLSELRDYGGVHVTTSSPLSLSSSISAPHQSSASLSCSSVLSCNTDEPLFLASAESSQLGQRHASMRQTEARVEYHEGGLSSAELRHFHSRVAHFVRDHLTVVCPSLPQGMSAAQVARKYSRQYPVARFCAEHGLSVCPVDHPKSLSKSALLHDMLSSADSSSCHHGRGGSCPHSSICPDNGAGDTMLSEEAVHSSPLHTWSQYGHSLHDYDLAVIVSFRYFLPVPLLQALPPTINMHPSLLPRYRGASPIFSTLMRNEARGGVSIIQVRPEQKAMDSGHILWQCEVPIHRDTDVRLYFPLITQIGAAGLCDLIFGEMLDPTRSSNSLGDGIAHIVNSGCSDPNGRNNRSNSRRALSDRSADHTQRGEASASADVSATASACSDGHTRMYEVVVSDGCARRDSAARTNSTGMSTNAHATSLSWAAVRGWLGNAQNSAGAADREATLTPSASWPLDVAAATTLSCTTDPCSALQVTHKDDDDSRDHSTSNGIDDGTLGAVECTQSTATAAAADNDAASPARVWSTRLRQPQRLTAEAVEAAAQTHRHYHLQQYCSSDVLRQTVTMRKPCAQLFPHSVLNWHCDWPDSFTYSWRFAIPQSYPQYRRFTHDPFHAPLLAKDAALLRFHTHTAMQVFGVWRAFVGGQYFHPAVHAMLDKNVSPVGQQLRERARGRVGRRGRVALQSNDSKASDPNHTSPSRCATLVCSHFITESVKSCHTGYGATCATLHDKSDARTGCMTHAPQDRARLEGEVAELLRLCCCFTRAKHPQHISAAVMAELHLLEQQPSAQMYFAVDLLTRSQVRANDEASVPSRSALRDSESAATATTTTACIPPGTAYFPRSDAELGAIKCREGWFFWNEVHVNKAVRAQSASLLRKGLAMKVGVLYRGLFGEYTHIHKHALGEPLHNE